MTITGKKQDVVPVNLLLGILTARPQLLDETIQEIVKILGPFDFRSEWFPFTVTDYYDQELGSPIFRCFLSLKQLVEPSYIIEVKHQIALLEDRYRENGWRKINIDPGYFDFYKLVLASFKVGAFKIYLGQGVYGDMTLLYSKGKFTPFEWAFADFASGKYNDVFLTIRNLYKKKLKELRDTEPQ